ncbi:MAG: hypothetical protein H7Z72_18130 [Bacteroidetes bacterium]|nr:hypothetical protein [Fibrella sp.]
MKRSVLLFLLLAGCQSPAARQDAQLADGTGEYVNTRIDNEPTLRIPSLEPKTGSLTLEQMKSLPEKRRVLLGRLWQLSPIPVPGPTNSVAITAEVAHERYVDFVAKHAGDSILPLFQQRYARILLNDYRWLETGRADVIAYYVDQLLLSGSRDLKTITAGLVRVQEKLPAPQFAFLVNRALPMAEEQLAAEAHSLSEYAYRKTKGLDRIDSATEKDKYRDQRLAWEQHILLKQKKTYKEDSMSVARLRTLPLG